MAYTKTEWYVQAPITQESMNKIEQGIYDAHQDIGAANDSIREVSSRVTQAETNIGNAQTDITNIRSSISNMTSNADDGRKAWAQVSGAITMNGDVVTKSLNDRIGEIEGKQNTMQIEITNAHRDNGDSLVKRFESNERDINSAFGAINSLNNDYDEAAGGHESLNIRLDSDESRIGTNETAISAIQQEIINARGSNNSELKDHFDNIDNQLKNAKNSSVKSHIFETLDERFEELETEMVNARGGQSDLDARLDKIDDLSRDNSLVKRMSNAETRLDTDEALIVEAQGNISALRSGKVNVSDVENAVNIDIAGKVLDARVGKTLQDQITLLQQNASTEGGRIDALETELAMSEQDGERRLDDIEAEVGGHSTELNNAHVSTANDTSYGSIDARFEAAETKANTLESDLDDVSTLANQLQADVQTIAGELDMIHNDQISSTNSRIDSLESTVNSLSSTLGDQSDFGDRIAAAESDIDDLQDRMGSMEGTVTGANGLQDRMLAAEQAISHAAGNDDPGGLTQRMAAVETAAANAQQTADNAATQSSVTTLTGRVTTLEGKDTVIIDNATFDEETGLPTSIGSGVTPSENCDYLIKGADDKYYYWRYFSAQTGWQLISGAGGGGGGNSSGFDFEDAEDYEALEEYAENTDYYVQSEEGVHHYRWVPYVDPNTGETSLVEIEIGCVTDTDNIKKYNVAVESLTNETDGTTQHYLNLYEFDANESNVIDANDEENEITRLESKRIRHILLPATGGGGSGSTASMKFTRITPRIFTSAVNGDQPMQVQFFFTTGEANDGAYYDLYIGRIVNNVVTDERKVLSDVAITSGDPADKSTSWPTVNIIENGEVVGTRPATATEVAQGFYSIDVSSYFNQVGYYSIRLAARSADNTSLTGGINWELHTINFDLTSESEDGLIVSVNDPVTLEYKPFGAIDKTFYLVIDNDTEHARTVALSQRVSGTSTSIEIPARALAHGLHKIDMYMVAVINNVEVPTKHIYREYIWYDANDEEASPIIVASRYNGQTLNVQAYTDLSIPYSIYHKESGTYLVEYYLDYGTANETLLGQIQTSGNLIDQYDYVPVTADNSDETHTLTIKVGDQTASVTLNVSPIEQDVAPIRGAVIDFDPTSYTNSSLNREPEWKTSTTAYDEYNEWVPGATYAEGMNVLYNGYAYTCRTAHRDTTWVPAHWAEQGAYKYTFKVSDNFNWSDDASGGGYKTDEDGKCFVIKAGSYVDINYKMFKNVGGQSAIYDTGAEMKIIFKTMAVRDASAIWFTNVKSVNDKQIGIQLSAHQGWLKTDKASDGAVTAQDDYDDWESGTSYMVGAIVVYDRANDGTIYQCKTANSDDEFDDGNWLKIGKIESTVDATNTYLYFPYSEEDKIELDININRYIQGANNNFIMSYEDGVPSKALPYTYGPGGDGLYHPTGEEATIRIGSADCDVHIYRLRIYNNSLETSDILQNFIADGKTIKEKVDRYNRNCIYWDEEQQRFFTAKDAPVTAKLNPVKLAEKMPGVKVLMLEAPTFTLNKKSFIKDTSLRCLQIQTDNNGNFVYPPEGNWFFRNGYHSGQGTTSDNYGQAGRNIDFLFECDGVNYPAKAKNMKDYKPDGSYVSNLLRGNDTSKWVVVGHDANDNEIYGWEAVDGAVAEECTNWKGDDCKIQLTPTSVPNNYFNLKVNIASSENVNNALFQKRYNEYIQQIVASPATANQNAYHNYAADERYSGPITAKNTMEFVPAVIFLRETKVDSNGNPTGHVEFNDCDWHFYALGNIGDSKKTDYTRAYDPTDMNEFTVEISDNNTNNSQFQSGVYEYGGERVVEQADSGTNSMNFLWGITDEQWNATREPNADELAIRARINDGEEDLVDVIMGGELEDGSDGEVYVNYRHRMLHCEPFDGDHSFEFRYACQGDYRDGDLINPQKTDTAPELVARYKADKAQEKLNRKVIEAFYEWLVTADETQFRDEASLWFVPTAMEFFYAFTHYYTMMDNRAKNTFWHWAKTGSRRAVPIGRAVKALMHVYEESDGNGGYQPASGDFDNTKQYYTQYAFDLWVYDCDTAAGIDNNGALVFPYGKEDTDYRTEGDALSGYAFNGAGSIFWRRISRTFTSDIRTVMTSAPVNCFNAQHLIDEFDATQDCYPEEVWRLDIQRKYIRTFTGVSARQPYDNAVAEGKQNPRFLRSMMQGRKKYQRRQWIRDQGVYFNSKYRLTDIIQNDNTIEFNATTPAVPEWKAKTSYYINDYVRTRVEPFDELKPKFNVYRCIEANSDTTFTPAHWQASVTPTYLLTLTPYQDMYLNVQVGNGNYQPQYRAKAGRTYTYDISGNYQETRVYINGANHLSAIGGLAPMYPYEFDLRALAHLKVLDIGTDDTTYTNTKFTTLGLETNKPLLETLNIKNCHSLGGAINLSNASNIRTVEAAGTVVTTVNLPQYTNIETLHLPITATDISLYAARNLTDFAIYDSNGNIDFSRIVKLEVKDSDYSANINWIDIALEMIDNSTTIKLLDLRQSDITNLEDVEPFRVRKQLIETGAEAIVLSGNITVNGEWSEIEKLQYEEIWNDLHFLVIDDATHKKVKHKLTYIYEIDGIQREYSKYVNNNATIEDIYTEGIITEMPTKEVTAEKTYVFGTQENDVYIEFTGWRIRGDEKTLYERYETDGYVPRVTSNTVIEPVFTGTDRKYYIRWYLRSTDTTPIKTAGPYNYGTGEASEAPTVADIQAANRDTCSYLFNRESNPVTVEYHIFNGWSKLPIKIAPDEIHDNFINIYGVWIDGNTDLDTLFADTSNMSPEQLYVFAHMTDTERARYADVGKQITFNVGYTGSDNSGTLLIGPGSTYVMTTDQNRTATYPIARFNSVNDHAFRANIQPLAAGNDEFTLAIDYSFDATALDEQSNMTEAVLLSCYEKGSSVAGFKLYHYNATGLSGPRLSFGDTSLTNGQTNQSVLLGLTSTAKYRNTIVLRHPKGSTKLYVYSGINGTAQGNGLSAGNMLIDMKNNTAIQEITWNNVNTDAYLVFGNVEFGNSSTTVVGAKGTIYWAKYWNKDLGVGECRNLACWNHEQMTFAIEEFSGMNPKYAGRFVFPSGSALPNLVLTSVTASNYGHIILDGDKNAAEGHTIQWNGSALQSVANKRIFWSLPIALQSIITKSPVRSRQSVQSSTAYNSTHSIAGTDVVITDDYVFLPSCVEMGHNDTSDIYKPHEALNYMRWYSGGNTVVHRWDSGSTSWQVENGGNAQYMNLRFPVVAIKTDDPDDESMNNVYYNYSSTTTSIYDAIGGQDVIQRGDIFVHTNGTAYMYVTADDITAGANIVYATATNNKFYYCNGRGGWIKADSYWLRSPFDNNGTSGTFMFVKTNGEIQVGAVNKTADGNGFSYSFSI